MLPNGQDAEKFDSTRKIALVGLSNCDLWALHSFLKEFDHTNLLPKRENILLIGSECKPDRYCFCEKMGTDKYAPFDLFIQEEGNNVAIFSTTKNGEAILRKTEIKKSQKRPILKKIGEDGEKIDANKIEKVISDRAKNEEFWQGIADNCFGCGACTAVCPLCFCTRQEFENFLPLDKGEVEGVDLTCKSSQCLNWDSCFAKRFSEVQNHYDLRPENVDRLYNWYHHKFVRAKFKHDQFLCTGCGRCIEACPANLNINNILQALINKSK